jgi:hypothetical protein
MQKGRRNRCAGNRDVEQLVGEEIRGGDAVQDLLAGGVGPLGRA